jgi:hypothetical protein
VFNSPTNAIDPTGLAWSWGFAGIGAVIGAGIGVVTYVGISVLRGQPITLGGLAGAAAGGAIAGGIAGGLIGAGTGDPSALAVIASGVLVGGVSGAAGGFTDSVVSQAIDQGQINWNQVAVDTGVAGAIGAATGGLFGCGKVLLRPRPAVPARPLGRPAIEPPTSQPVERVRPPSQYPRPPADPTQPPGPDWQWRGRGPVGSERESW